MQNDKLYIRTVRREVKRHREEKEGVFYLSEYLDGWKAKWLNKALNFLRKKGVVKDYYATVEREYFKTHLEAVVDVREVSSLVARALEEARFRYDREIECVILGHDVFYTLARGMVGSAECVTFPLELRHADRSPSGEVRYYLFNVRVKVVPEFEGILVVPADR